MCHRTVMDVPERKPYGGPSGNKTTEMKSFSSFTQAGVNNSVSLCVCSCSRLIDEKWMDLFFLRIFHNEPYSYSVAQKF